jgi:hypothetical protein
MADVSVDSATFNKLASSLRDQSVALSKLTTQLGQDNKREFLQDSKPVTIEGVKSGGRMLPFDTAIANAVARTQTPTVIKEEKEEKSSLLGTLLKGVLAVGTGFIIFKAIMSSPYLKEKFNELKKRVSDFFVGDNGILTKVYNYLFADGTGEDAGIIRKFVRNLRDMFPEGSFLHKAANVLANVLQSSGEFLEGIPFWGVAIENFLSEIRTTIEGKINETVEFGKTKIRDIIQYINETIMDSEIYKNLMSIIDPIKEGTIANVLFENINKQVQALHDDAKKKIESLRGISDTAIDELYKSIDTKVKALTEDYITPALDKVDKIIDKVISLKNSLTEKTLLGVGPSPLDVLNKMVSNITTAAAKIEKITMDMPAMQTALAATVNQVNALITKIDGSPTMRAIVKLGTYDPAVTLALAKKSMGVTAGDVKATRGGVMDEALMQGKLKLDKAKQEKLLQALTGPASLKTTIETLDTSINNLGEKIDDLIDNLSTENISNPNNTTAFINNMESLPGGGIGDGGRSAMRI